MTQIILIMKILLPTDQQIPEWTQQDLIVIPFQPISATKTPPFWWRQETLQDHREDISKFESRLNRTSYSILKDFINRTLPVLQKHQNHVETLVKENM